MKYIIAAVSLITAIGSNAQDLSTEIVVNHEIVPEEKAATRMRWLPEISLPEVSLGRLPLNTTFMQGSLTPYILPLGVAQYADTMICSPLRGYVGLGYGPTYNLAASAGYSWIRKENLSVNTYMQFDGNSYTSKYYGIPYDGKVNFHRNTIMVGGDVACRVGEHNVEGELLYQYSGYNFPVLNLATSLTDKYYIDANVVKANVGWNTLYRKVAFHAAVNYGMIYFGRNQANNNRVAFRSGMAWHASTKSTWLFDFNFSIDNSLLAGNKEIYELHPAYEFSSSKFKLRAGLDIDIPKCSVWDEVGFTLMPDLQLEWMPSSYFNLWLKSTWDLLDNNRLAMYDEQPYLMTDFDAEEVSAIWKMQLGIGLGPFRGASLRVYAGPNIGVNWYIPDYSTGYMDRVNKIGGLLMGVIFSYEYRRYLTLNFNAEYAPRHSGDYTSGYAPWRDHAKFNLVAQATVRPLKNLDITLGYQLRSDREKMLSELRDLNLRTISNLQVGVRYGFTSQWSAYVRGENLLNKHWYLGPAVPCQGIMGMIGATYKF